MVKKLANEVSNQKVNELTIIYFTKRTTKKPISHLIFLKTH